RFGEDDATLQLEEKMWARMQKDRSQRSRSGGIFNLGDDAGGPTELLTHRGQALGGIDDHGGYPDDEEDDLNAEVEDSSSPRAIRRRYRIDASDFEEALIWLASLSLVDAGEKTRQEVLNEIIAKSKERKLEKARGKEEQESERERLDEGMGELLSMLNQRPTKGEGTAPRGQSDDYDLAMRV
ncbi:unnamed protein product, partial [Hapterophycus canaliculatus]